MVSQKERPEGLGIFRGPWLRVGLRSRGVLLAALVGLGVGCSSPALQKNEINAVVTIEETKLDYTAYKTFKVATRAVELCGILADDEKLPPTGIGGEGGRTGLDENFCYSQLFHGADDEIAAAITKEMTSRGYVVAASGEKPDLVIGMGIVARTAWTYGPDYVWCEPELAYQCWYPKKSYPYTFGAGTFLINMFSTSAGKPDDLASVWFASLSGVYSEDETTFANSAIASLKTAFAQSKKLPKVSP